jgi:hypothetical protein
VLSASALHVITLLLYLIYYVAAISAPECAQNLSQLVALSQWKTIMLYSMRLQVEKMRLTIDVTDPSRCQSASEWDAITVEQFKQSNIWTSGE